MAITSNQLREAFLAYFKRKKHTILPSSSLVPYNDTTLLFTNAGMVQFKDLFLGLEKRDYTRATTAQRCVRAGGKHNDLDQVGYTARHHTFFEMLGNFSFGDYFKEDAIAFAWEFLTQELKLSSEKLWVTVFQDDDEAFAIWENQIGVPADRIIRCGEKSNFWAMGDTGPCGPCTEIFYDHGPEIAGGPPGSPDEDGDRYVEIWNLVFMQFDRTPDGELKPLPKPSVDTGMGLERLTTVMQGKHNNYDTDVFYEILQAIALLCGESDLTHTSMRVIADHIRSCSFLIVDGVLPSNEGRGYVLRRIIRRAIRHGHKLGIRDVFFYKLVAPLVEKMGAAYPELKNNQAKIEQTLAQEENQFLKTLDQGLRILELEIGKLGQHSSSLTELASGKKGEKHTERSPAAYTPVCEETSTGATKLFDAEVELCQRTIIPGEIIFRLYDTYGFPPDLTNDIARERGLSLDMAGFEHEMTKQRVLSQQSSKFATQHQHQFEVSTTSTFTGYQGTAYENSTVAELFHEGQPCQQLHLQNELLTDMIVLTHTPFYAESGGQIGDQGFLTSDTGVFQVLDTQKRQDSILHIGHVIKGYIEKNQMIKAEVDQVLRLKTALNHSATHLLHKALKEILGQHVQQKGSLVAPDRLRFDFSHSAPITLEQLQAIELLVNRYVHANVPIETHLLSQQEAIARGAEALFGEKYGEEVRVLQMGEFSLELCGGTHATRTGDIGLFRIITETGIAAGVRRIEAVTGEDALLLNAEQQTVLVQSALQLKTNWKSLTLKIDEFLNQQRQTQKQLETLSIKLASHFSSELLEKMDFIAKIPVLIANVGQADAKRLRELVDQLKSRRQDAIILLGASAGDKVSLLAYVSLQHTQLISAVELVNYAAQVVGGKGGGRPELAQAGGVDAAKLDVGLSTAFTRLKEKLAQ